MEKKIELIKKIADYEAEIVELENLIIHNVSVDKISLYKKDLTILKTNYTKTKNQLNNLIKKEKINAE